MRKHKTTTKTAAGELMVWLIRNGEEEPLRITVFKMGEEYAKTHGLPSAIWDGEVQVFDSKSRSWKVVIPNGTFAPEEISEWVKGDEVVKKFGEYLSLFFSIEIPLE